MKILIADSLPEDKIEILREKNYECIVEPDLSAEQIPEKISGIEVLVVRSTEVTSEVFEKSDSLGLVVRSGAGVNTIDCQAAADFGVYVCNVPGTNSIAVAELTMGLMIAIDRHIPSATADLKEGKWNKKMYSKAQGLFGKTIGIIGLGEIGLAVAERAKSFGMTVIAKKATRKPEAESKIRSTGIKLVDTIEDLIEESDVISIVNHYLTIPPTYKISYHQKSTLDYWIRRSQMMSFQYIYLATLKPKISLTRNFYN